MNPYPCKHCLDYEVERRQQVVAERQTEKLAASGFDDPAKWKLTRITHDFGDGSNWSFTERTYEMTPAYKVGIESGKEGNKQ